LPVAPTVRTGSGGLHLFFAHPGGIVRNRVGLLPGVDLRGDGGFVVAPPSIHPSGGGVRLEVDTARLLPPPAWLLSETPPSFPVKPPDAAPRLFLVKQPNNGIIPIHEGQRNPELFRIACAMRGRGESRELIEAELVGVNQARCIPPLPPDEVAAIARSATRYLPAKPLTGEQHEHHHR
jgi:hypothetical protein